MIHEVEEEDDRGRGTGKKSQIFRRYHQVDAVRWLIQDARGRGTGQRYLVQHSAGSGKSMSIAWLAHQLSSLHDADDRRVFDSIIVVTDRRVLDRQLDRTIRSFEKTLGVVAHADSAQELKEALEQKKNIIVSTLQKFPYISQGMGRLPGTRFAVIVDEAHSSQSGEMTKSLKQVLTSWSLEEAEREDELEGFILDVLQNYTTYQTYWKLLKTAQDDPTYERDKAHRLLRAFVELHDHAIREKVRIMAEHFHHTNDAERTGAAAPWL